MSTALQVLALAVVTASSLSCAAADDEAFTSEVVEGRHLPDTFVTEEGLRWVKTRDVVYDDNGGNSGADEAEGSAHPAESQGRLTHEPGRVELMDLPLEELVEEIRPVGEFGGVEYVLDDESALEFARTLKEAHDRGLLPTSGEPSEDVRIGRSIIGNDQRERVNKPWDNGPEMRKIATYGTPGNPAGPGTIFKMIDHYTAVTAAHVVHDGANWTSRQQIQFGASAEDPSPNDWTSTGCYSIVVPGGWDTDHDGADDYAVITLRGGWADANCDLSDFDVGYMGWTDVGCGSDDLQGIVAGYPGKGNSDTPANSPSWVEPEMFRHENSTGYISCAFPNMHFYKNDTSPGQSGAPYYQNGGYVRAIHKGNYDSDENWGKRMTSSLVGWIASYQGD